MSITTSAVTAIALTYTTGTSWSVFTNSNLATAGNLQANWNDTLSGLSGQYKPLLNSCAQEINILEGTSGAQYIGVSGLTGIATGTTVYSALASLNNVLNGASGAQHIGISGLTGIATGTTVYSAIASLNSVLNGASGSYYVGYSSSDSLGSSYTSHLADVAYVLKEADNLQTILDSGKTFIALNPSYGYSFNGITVPTETKIIGNGATITSPDTTNPVFDLTGCDDFSVQGVCFVGSTGSPDNAAMVATDSAISIIGTKKLRITDCTFENFLGAAINDKGYAGGAVEKLINHTISNNKIYRCYFGITLWKEAEYNVILGNRIAYCRVGIWNSAGNNNITGNTIVRCRAAYVSTDDINDIIVDAGTNRDHGNVVGNIFNHCKADQTDVGWKTANYLINSVDYHSVWVDGANGTIPPNFVGNTLYYTDILYTGATASTMPFWIISGCVLSNMTISCDAIEKLSIIGCSERSDVIKTNIIVYGSAREAWQEATFENSWAVKSGFAAGFRKSNGKIQMYGVIDSGVANTVAFTLPAGYRPVGRDVRLPVYVNGDVGTVQITTSGTVKIVTFTDWVSLDAIEFDIY